MNLRLSGKAQARRALGLIEDGVDGLEENITEDAEANASVGLNATEASLAARGQWCVRDVRAGHGEGLATDGDVEVRWVAAAGEGVASLLGVVRATGLGVVGLDDGGWQVEEGGTSIGDGGANAAGGGVVGTDGVTAGGELPEALRVVDWNVGDRAGVLGGVDVAGMTC